MNNDIKVVKKENDEIVLEEVNKKAVFMKKYGKYGVLLLLLFLLIVGITVVINLGNSDDFVLDDPDVEIEFPNGDDVEIGEEDEKPSTDNKPENKPGNSTENKPGNGSGNNAGSDDVIKDPDDLFDEFFNIPDEVSFKIKNLVLPDKNIVFYSDYTVKIIYSTGKIHRVLPLNNTYSVDDKGNINPEAKKMEIKVVKKEQTNHGLVTYYSDFSAEVEENNMDIWVGKKENIKENYITDNKIAYSNDIKEYDTYRVTDYHDGTIFIETKDKNNVNLTNFGLSLNKNKYAKTLNSVTSEKKFPTFVENEDKVENKRYFVRNIENVELTENGFNFKIDNYAEVIKRVVLDNDFVIDYLSDGGAIVEGPEGNISVRRSNSIIIENNKLIKIKLSNLVEEVYRKEYDDKEIVNFDDGTSIIIEGGEPARIIPEDPTKPLECKNNICNDEDIGEDLESKSTPNDCAVIYTFEGGTSFVDNKNCGNAQSIIDKSDNVVVEDGVVVIINSDVQKIDISDIIINNKSSNKVKIRVVFENSDKTTLQNTFFKDVKYKISAENVEKSINSNPWDNNEKEYILYETELKSKEQVKYRLGIWLDYEGLDNSAMGKSFFGTLKVYSWEQK